MFICLFFCFIIGSGCNRVSGEPSSPKGVKNIKERPSLSIGLIPERDLFDQLERYQPVADYLSNEIDVDIKLNLLNRYGNIVDYFSLLNLDAAFFGSFAFALTHSKLGVEPLARPENADGVSTYHGLIFVRKDSNITNAESMRGKVFVFVDKATTAGYLLPLFFFKTHDIKDYRAFFKETYFAGTHQNAIVDVLNRRADIGAAKNTVFDYLLNKDKRLQNKLVILARSPDVPENGLAVKKDFNAFLKKKLKEALLNMHKKPDGVLALKRFGARKFIETTMSDYASVYEYAQKIPLDLSTFDYMND